MTWYSVAGKKRKDRPRTTWIDGIGGMRVEMSLTEED